MSSSRKEPNDGDDEPGGARVKADDPALALRARTRRRLIGAAALLLGAVVVLPMLLDSTPKTVPDDIAITVTKPPAARPETRTAPAPVPKAVEPAPVAEPTQPPAEAPIAAPAARAESKPTTEAKPPAADPKPSAEQKVPAEAKPQPEAKPAEAKPQAEPAPPRPAQTPQNGKVVVQVAALSSHAAAEELQVRLIKDGFTVYLTQVTTANGIVHRVRIGPYASRDEAQRAIERLKTAGHKATIVGG
jgi:DedD protein